MRRGGRDENLLAVSQVVQQNAAEPGLGERVRVVPWMIFETLRGRSTGVSRLRLLVMLFGAGYVVSPLDFVPEVLLGPLGLADDGLVSVALVAFLLSSADTYLRRRSRTDDLPVS